MDALIGVLIAWIVTKTGMLAPPHPPVIFVPEAQLVQMFYGPKRELASVARIHALYSHQEEKIYLVTGWIIDDFLHISQLLHELVHHVQRFNKIKAPCLAAYERQAFDLQLVWLREQGVEDPYALLDINEFMIMLSSRCPWTDE